MDNVVDLSKYKEKATEMDREMDKSLEWAREFLIDASEECDFNSERMYFLWRYMTDLLLVSEWSPNMLRDNLEFDIGFYLEGLEDEEQ